MSVLDPVPMLDSFSICVVLVLCFICTIPVMLVSSVDTQNNNRASSEYKYNNMKLMHGQFCDLLG